jgi:hypothetical protein
VLGVRVPARRLRAGPCLRHVTYPPFAAYASPSPTPATRYARRASHAHARPEESLMPKYIEITEDEAWAIDHTIRHTYSEGGATVGHDLLLKVMAVVLEFEDRRGKPFAPETLAVAVTEDECWAIDHQIRCDLTVNNKPVGRAILIKVFRALTEFTNDRDSESGVLRLGNLADLLRPPPEETPGGDPAHDTPASGDVPSQDGDNPPFRPDGRLPRDK